MRSKVYFEHEFSIPFYVSILIMLDSALEGAEYVCNTPPCRVSILIMLDSALEAPLLERYAP